MLEDHVKEKSSQKRIKKAKEQIFEWEKGIPGRRASLYGYCKVRKSFQVPKTDIYEGDR